MRKSDEAFAPERLTEKAKQCGFFLCPTCGLVWFGRADCDYCPEGPHAEPVHVAVLCRLCDEVIPIHLFADHLVDVRHNLGKIKSAISRANLNEANLSDAILTATVLGGTRLTDASGHRLAVKRARQALD